MAESGALRELITLFQLGVDAEELEKGEKKLEGFLGRVRKVGEVVAEAFAVHLVKEFFAEQIEGAAHVQDLAERLDVSAASLKEFGIVAAGAGVDLDSAAASLGFLQKTLGDAETKGGEAAAALQRLGISAKDAAGKALPDLLGDVAEGLSKLPNQNQRAAAAMAIFGRQGKALVPILSQGREAMVAMTDEAKELTAGLGDDWYAAAKKAREEGERFGFALDTIKARVTLAVLPGITKLMLQLKKGAIAFIDFTRHTYVLQTAMTALGVAAGVKLVSTLASLGKALGLLKPTIGETVAALVEFALPLVIAGALYLAFDEIFTLMKGGKTVIGDTLNELTGDTFASAKAAIYLQSAWDYTTDVMENFAAIIAGTVIPIVVTLWETCVGIGNVLADVFTGKFGDVAGEIKISTAKIAAAVEAGKNTIANAYQGNNIKRDAKKREDALANTQDPSKYSPSTKALLDRLDPDNNKDPSKYSTHTKALLARLRNHGAEASTATAQRGGGSVAPAAGGNGAPKIVINQTNHIERKNDEDVAGKIGKATGQGVTSATEKRMNNAVIAQRTR